ncbi:sensor histidine kinase [Glaciecola petra]|uniref:Histidine kinase n=1 Tax=Glaciecola petra TaxID=3075602 RepID=A0ABU2ZTK7_9ALTE|nr:histidine kinase [Aestuariibacter sp. P117]MDT0595967.1 histidine kinase [Aestuariibacter sp. P117]
MGTKDKKSIISLENSSAIATWAIVTGISIYFLVSNSNFSALYAFFTFLACSLYMALWLVATSHSESIKPLFRLSCTILLFFSVILIYFLVPFPFVAIFMVIFSAITPYYMSIKRALMLSPFWALPQFLIFEFYWQQSGSLLSAMLFWTFNIFALVMVNTTLREREARMQVELSNRQLKATQSLLNEAVKQSERVRIARNIHDLLGHHLTALTINLQVASHKSSGEVKESVEQCHQLAKLLLSDVREAVSDIREKSQLDLKASIEQMLEKLPDLDVALAYPDDMAITDIQIADTILKSIQESITNTMRHAQGKNVKVDIHFDSEKQTNLHIEIENDGKMPKEITFGNGLKGIIERVNAIQGNVEFILKQGKFYTLIQIPVMQHD